MTFQTIAQKAIEAADIIQAFDETPVDKIVSNNPSVIELGIMGTTIHIASDAMLTIDDDGCTCLLDLRTQASYFVTLLKLTPLSLTDF